MRSRTGSSSRGTCWRVSRASGPPRSSSITTRSEATACAAARLVSGVPRELPEHSLRDGRPRRPSRRECSGSSRGTPLTNRAAAHAVASLLVVIELERGGPDARLTRQHVPLLELPVLERIVLRHRHFTANHL